MRWLPDSIPGFWPQGVRFSFAEWTSRAEREQDVETSTRAVPASKPGLHAAVCGAGRSHSSRRYGGDLADRLCSHLGVQDVAGEFRAVNPVGAAKQRHG